MMLFIMGLYTALCVAVLINIPTFIIPQVIEFGIRSGDAVGITVVSSFMAFIVMVLFGALIVRHKGLD